MSLGGGSRSCPVKTRSSGHPVWSDMIFFKEIWNFSVFVFFYWPFVFQLSTS